jgi:hypothetical protein
MKKILLPVLVALATVGLGCNANENKTAEQEQTTTAAPDAKNSPAPAGDNETKATAELCACVNNYLADMSPKVKQILIDASKSENPVVVLTTELQKIRSEEEQQQLAREFQKFENDQQLQQCSEDVKRKYNLDENDLKSRDRLLTAAEQNKDCEVVYALMKIGQQQGIGAGGNR